MAVKTWTSACRFEFAGFVSSQSLCAGMMGCWSIGCSSRVGCWKCFRGPAFENCMFGFTAAASKGSFAFDSGTAFGPRIANRSFTNSFSRSGSSLDSRPIQTYWAAGSNLIFPYSIEQMCLGPGVWKEAEKERIQWAHWERFETSGTRQNKGY